MKKLYSALILLSVIWGTSFLFIKILVADISPAAVVFGRSLFGFLTICICFIFMREKLELKKLPWKMLFLVGILNNALPWLLISTSELMISSSLASIINATTPIWTLIIGSLFFASMLRKNQWIGIMIGFIGIFILSDIKFEELWSENTIGIILMSAAALCYGVSSHLSKKHLGNVSTLMISMWTLFASMIIGFFLTLFTSPASFGEMLNMDIILSFIGLGAFGSGFAYLLFYFMVKEGGPEFASLVTYIVPVSAIFWGALLLNEEIHLSMIFGLLIIIAGVYISSMKVKSQKLKRVQFQNKSRKEVS